MKTISCKFLDYDENKYSKDCKISGLGSDKFVWERQDYEGKLQLCQFCSKRGRLNNPESCVSSFNACCDLYEEAEIEIIQRSVTDEN